MMMENKSTIKEKIVRAIILNSISQLLQRLKNSDILISIMAKQCTICEKTSAMSTRLVKLRGKYNPTAKVRKYPNLQWVTIPLQSKSPKGVVPFRGKRILACTKCMKALAK